MNYGYNIHGGLLFDKDFIELGLSQEKVIWLENGYQWDTWILLRRFQESQN